MILRPYQIEAADAIDRTHEGQRGALLVLGTGLGKTTILAESIRRRVARDGGRALVVNDNDAIIRQLARSIRLYSGLGVAVEKAERMSNETIYGKRAEVVVGSVQTLTLKREGSPRRIDRFAPMLFGTLAFDEAHRSLAPSWGLVAEHFAGVPSLRLIGATATPQRSDGRSFRGLYGDRPCFVYSATDGQRDGWLVPVVQSVVSVRGLDFSTIDDRGHDFDPEQLDAVLREEAPLHRMISAVIDIAGDRRCLAFCASIDHARLFASILNRHRPGSAAAVWGDMNEDTKRLTLEEWAAGRFQYLCNCNLLTEGWDDPATDGRGVQVIAVCRMTKMLSRYMQIAGRGLRPVGAYVDRYATAEERKAAIAASPKPCVEMIDFLGVTGRHRIVMATDAFGGEFDEETRSKAASLSAGRPEFVRRVSVEDTLREAADRVATEREERRRAAIKPRALYTVRRLDGTKPDELVAPKALPKDAGPAVTDRQLAFIAKRDPKFKPWPGMTERQARGIIAKLPWFTVRQGAVLRRAGHDPAKLEAAEGRALLDQLFAGWKR